MYLRDTLRLPAKGLRPSSHPIFPQLPEELNVEANSGLSRKVSKRSHTAKSLGVVCGMPRHPVGRGGVLLAGGPPAVHDEQVTGGGPR